jgi:tetratricopeptide (TPR) repeat protein
MGKYIFNDVFKEIVDTYDIDSTILGNMTDRDSSRIRHYKTDSKPVRSVLELLINSIGMIINETNDSYINSLLIEKLNRLANQRMLFTDDIRNTLLHTKEIQEYVPFILRRSLELNNDSVKEGATATKPGINSRTLVTKVAQAHQYFESNLYQDALDLYNDLLGCSSLIELPEQSLIIHTDLGLIYRNSGMNQYDIDTIRLAVKHFKLALKFVTDCGDPVANAIINKYLGTVYMSLSFLEDAENNLKRAINYFDISLSLLDGVNPEEYARVLINYGNLFIHYSNIRSARKFLKNSAAYLERALDYYRNTNNYFEGLIYLHCSSTYSLLSEISNTRENAEKAIQSIQNALRVFTIEDYPLLYAQCISNLGLVHMTMAQYDNTVENCNIAINHINQALRIFAENIDAYSYFIAHLNLSSIFILLVNTTKDYSYLEKAISSIEKCEKHKIPRNNSMNNIKTTLNHADTLIALAEVKKDTKLLVEAETLLNSTLETTTTMKYDYLVAMIESLLSKLSYVRFELTKNTAYLDDVLAHANTSIEFFSIQENPLYHAYVSHLIAKAYRYKGDYEKSKQVYEVILNIFTKEKYAEKHKLITDEYYDLCKEKGWQIILRL